ncbi:MAG: recombinase family protein [Peptococcaceae bacterium]|jgi:DNA invertase Pin-like site-specific DNA recombinase|nr:recombinase family protein [Peptococcaceae bacterium]
MTQKIYGYARGLGREKDAGAQVEALLAAGVSGDCIFVEQGSDMGRALKEYERLSAVLRRGDVVMVQRLDCLGRDYAEIAAAWQAITQKAGAGIRVLALPALDTTLTGHDSIGTLAADIFEQLFSWLAEQDSVAGRRRRSAVLTARRPRSCGRPKITKPERFDEIYSLWVSKRITLRKAMRLLRLKRSTFYKFAAEHKKLLAERP